MTEFCCEALEKATTDYQLPFDRPIYVDWAAGGELKSDRLAARLLKLTPGGSISKRGGAVAFLNYCPFCGKKLREDAPSREVVNDADH